MEGESMYCIKRLVLLLTLCWSGFASANSGVVFVHGTGAQTNALDEYWTRSFVNSVMVGHVNPAMYLVINCDFEQFMWDSRASGCMADQTTQFIQANNITSLYIITHSNGGNIVRWIMSNPTWDSRYPDIISRIRNVTALAPSSKGTPLADAVVNGNVFEQALGWLLGYASDAVKQQQVSWMQYYNTYWLLGTSGRPALPRSFKSVVGSDVDSSIFDSDSYCAGYSNQVALEVTQAWLSSCSDGFLDCTSQAGAGSVWFYDTWRTYGSEPLSHQQSRRDCFGLDVQLRNDV